MQIIKSQADGNFLNTETGAALSVADVTTLVRNGETFKVVEPAQERDVTSQVLAEIFVKEGLETKQAFIKRYVIDGLSAKSVKLDGLAQKLLNAGIGLAEEAIERFEALADKGQHAERGYAKVLRDGLHNLEQGPQQLQSKLEALFRKPVAAVEVINLTEKVDVPSDTVKQLNGHKAKADDRHAKKPASV